MSNQRAQPTDDTILETILRIKAELRKSDRKVAELVLDRPEAVLDMTLAALARAASVSEPTVIRFCAAIGCSGFREMRVRLARSLAFSRSTSHTAVSVDDDLQTIIAKVFDYNLANLAWAQNHLDGEEVARAVDLLADATRIEFFGFGASGIVARDAQQKFPLFDVPCGTPADAHQMFMTADMMRPGEVAVAISNTGQTRAVVEAAELCQARGASTIGISGAKSPLLDRCDVALVVETLENTDVYTPAVSRLSHLVVVDILSTAVSLRRGTEHQSRIARMKAGLTRLRSS
ncbi:MAG: MurR/RpiR family transcriptional regulator [Pseudomonadota bacterium]